MNTQVYNPLVSIILPIYNMSNYLKSCLDSLLDQTYTNLEIICVDDGSTDDSYELLTNFRKKDNRIKIIKKDNGGQASARNLGLKSSHGDYIMFVDPDDTVEKDFVFSPLTEAINNHYDLVVFDATVNRFGKKYVETFGKGIVGSDSCAWNKLYKANLWDNTQFPDGYWYEDLGVVPFVVCKATNSFYLNQPLYNYNLSRSDSQSNIKNPNRIMDEVHMCVRSYDLIVNYYNQKLSDSLNKELEQMFIKRLFYENLLLRIIYLTDKNRKKRLIEESLKIMNTYFKNWNLNDLTMVGFKNILKKRAVNSYIKGNFFIGDFYWKFPNYIFNKVR